MGADSFFSLPAEREGDDKQERDGNGDYFEIVHADSQSMTAEGASPETAI
jgi:hypothetical protein